MNNEQDSILKKATLIFLLGAATYAWWKITAKIKSKL